MRDWTSIFSRPPLVVLAVVVVVESDENHHRFCHCITPLASLATSDSWDSRGARPVASAEFLLLWIDQMVPRFATREVDVMVGVASTDLSLFLHCYTPMLFAGLVSLGIIPVLRKCGCTTV